ncbi:MAG: L-sorbosone dehydrogenase [Proteobacteria bacterium]|nr:L-sorbosone dehydrogenase [Pseudomonadota bacterium]
MRGFGVSGRVTAPALYFLLPLAALGLAGCAEHSLLPPNADIGPAPQIVKPVRSAVPTVNVAPAVGWPSGEMPTAAPGLKVTAFAAGLDHPRNVLALPNGDVLVAETATPPKPDDSPGLKGFVMRRLMAHAGAGGPSANRITLLRDTNGDGVADVRSTFLTGLNSPYGMALVGNNLYVANTDAIMRYPYKRGATAITGPGTKLTDLPGGTINHHWTKNLVASPDGRLLYASIGSNSNVGENGMAVEGDRAQIWQVDIRTGAHRPYATGLRNPNGLSFSGNTLWTSVNERDELGSDLVPDYMTSVKDGGFYGWPYSYFGQHVDSRVNPPRPDLVAKAIVPDYALGAHTASLGLAIANNSGLPQPYKAGAFVGQHGSWNRKPFAGYKVIFVPFSGGKPAGSPRDVLTGFIDAKGEAQGRPVGVTPDARGGLLVADDVGNVIWRVTGAK